MAEEDRSLFCDFSLPIPEPETFRCADADTKMNYLFDMQRVSLVNQKQVFGIVEERKKDHLKEVKRQRWIAGFTGIIGGLLGALFTKNIKL